MGVAVVSESAPDPEARPVCRDSHDFFALLNSPQDMASKRGAAERTTIGVTMRLLFAVLIGLVFLQPAQSALPLRDGDLVFQTSRSGQSLAVQRAPHSRWSHVGVVLMRGGKPFVFEASATVRYTPLKE